RFLLRRSPLRFGGRPIFDCFFLAIAPLPKKRCFARYTSRISLTRGEKGLEGEISAREMPCKRQRTSIWQTEKNSHSACQRRPVDISASARTPPTRLLRAVRFQRSRSADCCASPCARWKRCSTAQVRRRYERRDLPAMRQAVAGDCSAPCSFLFSGPSGGLSSVLDRRQNGSRTVSGGAYAR